MTSMSSTSIDPAAATGRSAATSGEVSPSAMRVSGEWASSQERSALRSSASSRNGSSTQNRPTSATASR